MRIVIHYLSLLTILSLSLIGVTGCGEKRLYVSTISGTPGEEASASSSNTDTSGFPKTSVEESSLTGQGSPLEEVRTDAMQPIAPINFVNKLSKPAQTDDVDSGSALGEDPGSLAPFPNGSDIATQSSSSSMNGIEPIPDRVQVAKAEPSDILREQLDNMKEEELAAAAAGLEDVFFQFDSWTLTAEARESLERDLKWLTTEPSSLLVIEGHADQRGTQAYNLVLGKRRAMATRDYLFQLGVDSSRLSVISYGKDRPFCLDLTEVCHQLNRRGHLLVQN